MFALLGRIVSRYWGLILIGWIGIVVGLKFLAPDLRDVLQQGEFAFLPEDSPSREAEELFLEAFPDDLLGSSVIIVVRRPSRDAALSQEDRDYIHEVLVPVFGAFGVRSSDEELTEYSPPINDLVARNPLLVLEEEESDIISRVRDWTHKSIGHMLESEDGQASLILIDLKTEFLEDSNIFVINKLREIREKLKFHKNQDLRIPDGLEISLSGSATVGRDMRVAAWESGKRTELATVIFVLVLLILIYRAPLLAIIPLITVGLSVMVSMLTLAVLAKYGWISLFKDIETYITVLVYGAGVDYCLFLISRYKEELDNGATYDEAISNSLAKVGAALAASAGTSSCGIGMMAFAEFGKFHQAGIGIFISLIICLCAALTFAPALMRLSGKWAFWPRIKSERISQAGWLSPTTLVGRIMQSGLLDRIWDTTIARIRKRPGRIWFLSIACMIPFAAIGVIFYNYLSYGLLSELPQDYVSVQGAKAIQEHFPAGSTGPVTVMLKNPTLDFSDDVVIEQIGELAEKVEARKDELDVADIRSVAEPTGITSVARKREKEEQARIAELPAPQMLANSGIRRKKIRDYYFTPVEELNQSVSRIDVVFGSDPFSRDSITNFILFRDEFEKLVAEFDEQMRRERAEMKAEELKFAKEDAESPEELAEIMAEIEEIPPLQPTEVSILGATASITDLKFVTDRDQIRIDILVLAVVYLILVLLLRKAMISLYLLASVFFTYFVSLGVTFCLFYLLDPTGFAGLDWKVPMFLFTILIAVGEDYNILLMTRIEEEQQDHGLVEGTLLALKKTGSIISSCGIIMAGTFSSLLFGTLYGMQQLGFALAFGVLLDTFVVRPILVPAWLVMLYRGRFGRFGKYLGAPDLTQEKLREQADSGTTEPLMEQQSERPKSEEVR